MVMYHHNDEFRLVKILADERNQSSVDNMFQNVILLIYIIFGESSSSNVGKGKFHVMIIKEMQKYQNSEYDKIFLNHFPTIYENTIMNNKLRWMLINWIKHNFLTEWITKFTSQMKSQVSTSIGNKETMLTTNGAKVLNDNDVNKVFGWTLFKVKKIYNALCNNGILDEIQVEKEKLISELSVMVDDVINNKNYVLMYYPIDRISILSYC